MSRFTEILFGTLLLAYLGLTMFVAGEVGSHWDATWYDKHIYAELALAVPVANLLSFGFGVLGIWFHRLSPNARTLLSPDEIRCTGYVWAGFLVILAFKIADPLTPRYSLLGIAAALGSGVAFTLLFPFAIRTYLDHKHNG